MVRLFLSASFLLGVTLCCVTAGYLVATLTAMLLARRRQRRLQTRPAGVWQPVSMLKPLHGAEPRLYENLRSFCRQDYPAFQLICGVHGADDPAIVTVRRLQVEFPDLDLKLIIDARLHGRNRKVSNLINIVQHARHPLLVIADSDISVGPDYLARVTPPLAMPGTGIVTCLYRGRALGGLWSRLGAMFINEWFAPSVLLSHLFGSRDFAFGATIAMRRETLDAIGGFKSVADHLADDYRLGQLTRRAGLETILSDYVVHTDVSEDAPVPLLRHELRWLRTIRSLNFPGYTFALISFALPTAVLGAALAQGSTAALALLAVTCVGRLLLHLAVAAKDSSLLHGGLWTLPLVPIRDAISVGLWALGLLGRRVEWGGEDLTFDAKGLLRDSAS